MTATDLDSARHVRTYGGWRRTRGMGLFGLSSVGTVVVLACLVIPLVLGSVSLQAGLIAAVPAVAIAAATLIRVDGTTIGHVLQRRSRWWWGTIRGYGTFRSGAVVEHADAWTLPGPLAATTLLSTEDGRGGAYGLVWDRRTGFLTATLRCAAASTWLVDGQDADGWVSNWHSWLASLGYSPVVRWVAVTVDTAPEPGATLQESVLRRLDPRAPTDTLTLMRELVQRSPSAAADVETRVSITFDPAASTHRFAEPDEKVDEVGRLLTGMESALATCGVTVLGRATAEELAAVVHGAYDPTMRGDLDRILTLPLEQRDETIRWDGAGPRARSRAGVLGPVRPRLRCLRLVGLARAPAAARHECGSHEAALARTFRQTRHPALPPAFGRPVSPNTRGAGQRGQLPGRLPSRPEAGRDRPRRRRPHARPTGRPRGGPRCGRRPHEHVPDGHSPGRARPCSGRR